MRRTCLEKLPVVTLLFCSSVRTKLGIPMATAPISVSWIGMNGYLRPRQVKSRHNSTDYNVFVRYRALTRSMLAMMVRPSFTMFFMEENSESINTMWAA